MISGRQDGCELWTRRAEPPVLRLARLRRALAAVAVDDASADDPLRGPQLPNAPLIAAFEDALSANQRPTSAQCFTPLNDKHTYVSSECYLRKIVEKFADTKQKLTQVAFHCR
jgi:hypothetical protein